MKRVLAVAALAVAAVAAVTSVAQAQFGIKAGISWNDVSNNGALPGDLGRRTGFAVGVGLQSPGPLGIGVEALYAQRGLERRELDYIEVPVYVRLEGTNEAVSPFAYVGPQVAFELDCDFDDVACPSGRDKVTYAGIIGAGLRFGVRAISLEARYVYGLSDLEFDTVSSSENFRTRSFMLLAGIGF